MFRQICCIFAMVVFLGACATRPDIDLQRFGALPQRYSQFDAVLAWEIKGADSTMMIDGEFKNVRYAFMDNIEVRVAVLDAAGKISAHAEDFIIPHLLGLDGAAPFSLKLPVKAVAGTKLRFTYSYTALEGGGGDGGDVGESTQNFDAEVPGR
jgi:hypothetical protein